MSISINIKSGQNKWEVKVDPSANVGELKKEISKVSDIPAENQRLIFSGKILKDDQTLVSYKIEDGHAVHLVKAGGNKAAGGNSSVGSGVGSEGQKRTTEAGQGNPSSTVPSSIAAGQTGGFNPLADLTGARYAGYANLPSTDMFGPDGGLNNAVGQEEILSMLENPIFQSQMNEMLSNPQMIDFLIQQHPHLQAMGPTAREMLQSPFFRQMMTNPDIIRQISRLQTGMGGGADDASGGFPAPGSATNNGDTTENTTSPPPNPFASLLNSQTNPFAAMATPPAVSSTGAAEPAQRTQNRGLNLPPLDPAMLSAMFGGSLPTSSQPPDNRPPEERYEQQLRQLNDMGFFDFDRNVAALRRSGGSVQGALDTLLNGDV